jgi:uroporphyrinogen III methyltransferase/synthase
MVGSKKKTPAHAEGKVYLVGSGPGDPGLLTIRGKKCLQEADVIVYDHLANERVLVHAKDHAELIYVGKKAGAHTMKQEDINTLLIDRAGKGEKVVRLKGGDPFIFGRGGEEAQRLAKAGICFEVVPGVTSAIAVPAYAGIPLTHRDFTAGIGFITGHEAPSKKESGIPWEQLASCFGTLVFLMGIGNLAKIAERLLTSGREPDTPVAVIQEGTYPTQFTLVGRLDNIARLAAEKGVKPPGIFVVGDVVKLREELNWFETRPLFGKRIVVTRAREQASSFLSALSRLGARCIEFPTIEIVPPESWDEIDRAIEELNKYQWLLFTSVNGVKFFLSSLDRCGRDIRDLKGIKIATIGPKTAGAWLRMGIRPDLMPDEYRAEALLTAFQNHSLEGVRFLLPRAAMAREILPDELARLGARVDVIPIYRTVKPAHRVAGVKRLLEQGLLDMVTFTSSSTVKNFVEMFDVDMTLLKQWMQRVSVACIGPVTAETVEKYGFSASLVASSYTIEALTDAIVGYFQTS